MLGAKITKSLLLAVIFLASALVLSEKDTWAAAGALHSCQPSSSCEVGEFLFDDEYVPITTATCTLTSRYPDGVLFLNGQALTSTTDGWYAHQFTAPTTQGLYRSIITCVTGGDTLSIDKSFNVEDAQHLSQGDVADAVWDAQRSSFSSSGSFGEALQNIVPSTGDISSSIWSYTNRTLSTFGTLISDIWNSSFSSSSSTSTASSSSDSSQTFNQAIQNLEQKANENRLLLEQLVNKPIIENVLEEEPDLQAKIDETKSVATGLRTNSAYIKSKASYINAKWYSIDTGKVKSIVGEISPLVGTEINQSNENVFGQVDWINQNWAWQNTQTMLTQARNIQRSISSLENELNSYGKSQKASTDIKNIIAAISQIEASLGNPSDTDTKTTVFGRLNSAISLASALDSQIKDVDNTLANWQDHQKDDLETKSASLSKELLLLNKIPQARNILASINPLRSAKNLKNEYYSIRGIANANKKFLAKKPGSSFSLTWLEEGSIIFKTLITNPSSLISQDVRFKYYLPPELKQEDIISMDNVLTSNYDVEKNQVYIEGTVTVAATETVTVSVKTEDIWVISESQVETLRQQAEDLTKPLDGTSFFAQGVTLKSDINVSLDKILELQKKNATPEAKIRAYREAEIELNSVNLKIEKLNDLVTQAGSVGSLKGFIGGAQVLAVWGIVIVVAAGFVFLAYYMKIIRKRAVKIKPSNVEIKTAKKKTFEEKIKAKETLVPPHSKKPNFKFVVFVAATLLVVTSIGAVGGKVLISKITSSDEAENTQAAITDEEGSDILGSNDEEESKTDQDLETAVSSVQVFVPPKSVVPVQNEPKINSTLITTLIKSQNVKKLESQENWVKIRTDGNIEGWISKDFVEEINFQSTSPHISNIAAGLVTINETPTGYLKVREKPWGVEITQVVPGEQYPLVEEQNEWLEIRLPDGTFGWISKQYALLN